MKRIAMTLVILLCAASLFAGGKECRMKEGKSVELNGTITHSDSKTVFRVANSDQTYTVCEQTKSSVLKLATDGTAVHVTGRVVSCGSGEELLIENAKKI
ncbi:MAG TPA: hypothetical protein VN181_03160 [Thermoanaerobaculia bacterium]|nr:hypothetical protein [Thermoanaerobaculia bacterium]